MGEEFSNLEKDEIYNSRLKRINDAIQLKKPDRVPIVSLAGFFLTRYGGISNREAMYDYAKLAKAWKTGLAKLNWDMAPQTLSILPAPAMDLIGIQTYKWPGRHLDDDNCYQYMEKEYLQADEYDEILKNPDGFIIRKLWPRIAASLVPLQKLPPLYLFSSGSSLMFGLGNFINSPEMKNLLETILDFGSEMQQCHNAHTSIRDDLRQMGFPSMGFAVAKTTFDWIADDLRGLKGTILDMYRQPDKLIKMIDVFTPERTEASIVSAKLSDSKMVFIPLHKGADGFMSDEQFKKFYWPSLEYLLLQLIDADLTPVPFFEGNYTSRLKYLATLPPGKIAGHFDAIDLKKFKDILGDMMCFWGNVPSHLLVTGNPSEVEDYVKNLIDTFKDTGGLIVDGAVDGVPPDSKIENVEAMTKAVFDYGVC